MTAIPMLHLHLEEHSHTYSVKKEAQKKLKNFLETLAAPNAHTHIFLERSKKCEISIIIGYT